MEIKVQYTGQLAGITGAGEEILDLPEGTSLSALVKLLCDRHGAQYSDLLVNVDGDLRPSTMVIFDGEQSVGNHSTTELDEVKTVMLMTPIAGG